MPTLPSLNALRAFEATARLGSVTAAANELSVTHGAVSRQLRTLERHFGTPLFDKHGRGLSLTAHGRELQQTASEAFARLAAGCATLTRRVSEAPFTLACPGSLLARWLIPRLDRLNAALPELRLRVVSSEAELDPRRDDIDATLCFAAPSSLEDKHVIPLAPERIVAVAAPGVWHDAARASPQAAVESLTLLETASRPQAWPQWAQAMGVDDATLGEARASGRTFEHLYYLLEAAQAGLGLAIAPDLLVAGECRQGTLEAPWPAFETGGRLALWVRDGASARRGEQLAAWLQSDLAKASRQDEASRCDSARWR